MKLRIREERERRGMTQFELAVASGVSISTIARAESGTHAPSVANLSALATALRVKLDRLVESDAGSAGRAT